MKNIHNFDSFVNEGLIKSQSSAILKRMLTKFFKSKKMKFYFGMQSTAWEDGRTALNYSVRVFFNNDKILDDMSIFDNLLKLISNLGWYIAVVTFDGDQITFDGDVKDLYNAMKHSGEADVMLNVERKFEPKVKAETKVMYHITDKRYLARIKHDGLVPRSKMKLSYHPERVYVADIKGIEQIRSRYCEYVENPVLLRVDVKGIDLHADPNAPYCYYTTSNIPPDRLTVEDDTVCSMEEMPMPTSGRVMSMNDLIKILAASPAYNPSGGLY